MRISDWSSDVCSSDLLGSGVFDRRRQELGDQLAQLFYAYRRHARAVASAARHGADAEQPRLRFPGRRMEGPASPPEKAAGGEHRMDRFRRDVHQRSEEHTSELQSLMRISYAVF